MWVIPGERKVSDEIKDRRVQKPPYAGLRATHEAGHDVHAAERTITISKLYNELEYSTRSSATSLRSGYQTWYRPDIDVDVGAFVAYDGQLMADCVKLFANS